MTEEVKINMIKSSIVGILLGEGGLSSNFCPDKQDKSLNMLMQKIKMSLLTDEEFKDTLTTELVNVYLTNCKHMGVQPSVENVPIVLYPYQCCLHAAHIATQIYAQKNNLKR